MESQMMNLFAIPVYRAMLGRSFTKNENGFLMKHYARQCPQFQTFRQ